VKTITLKIPESLQVQLNALARQSGKSRSEILRRALVQYVARKDEGLSGSFLDLSGDLAGSVNGPSDLSTNKTHLQEYGI
jgi:hypothetical protein